MSTNIKRRRTKKERSELLQESEKLTDAIIEANGLRDMHSLFSQQAAESQARLEAAQKLVDRLDTLEDLRQLPDFLILQLPLLIDSLNLLIADEEQRLASKQSGIEETNRLLEQNSY